MFVHKVIDILVLSSQGLETNFLPVLDTHPYLSVYLMETIQRHRQVQIQTAQRSLFTSMREELGVYLLERFLIDDATWTLLERQKEAERESEEEEGDMNCRYQPEGHVKERLMEGLSESESE